ncbi:probable membrane-associated tyrosine- and threonine-specific cdc2-inhibitory kinase at N-terminal half [Coccomyxa sp. Obi]|nr:probable membrane-associated tyrosine- and threonine-specific cdc2-inhibitory kinase at N-terminal half [Coccomyxa sp. Obi]
MSEKSPLSVLDFFGRGTPGWVKSRSQFGAASPHNDSCGGREKEHSSGFTDLKDHSLFSMSHQETSQQNRRKTGRRNYSKPSIEDALDESRVLMATSAALLRRTPSVMSPNLFAFEDHFSFEAVIGRSPMSEVYRARHRRTGQLFAVKRSMRRFRSTADRDRSLQEIQAVASLPSHPNVVTLHRAWQQKGHFYIQMDLAENGSLGSILRQRKQEGQLLPEATVWQVLWEAAQGLAFLHSHDVIVMDIKPDNLFCDHNGTIQIGDFGLAVVGSTQRDWEEGDGDYLAPELLCDDKPTSAADMYSLGATMYECATGDKLPRSWQYSCNRELVLPGRLPVLQQLVQGMLSTDPRSRLTAQQLVDQVGMLQLPFRLSAPVSSRASLESMPSLAGLDPLVGYSTPANQTLEYAATRTGDSSVTATCSSGQAQLPRRLNLAQLPSLTLPDAPSPSAVSTPVLCGAGWRRTQSSSDMSQDAYDVGTPTHTTSCFGPSQQRLSVSSPTPLSPFSEAGCSPFSTPALGRRPSTALAATPSFTGSTAFVYHSRWARECTIDRSDAAAQVRPFRLEPDDDMDRSASFQLDEDLPGRPAEDGLCGANILRLDGQDIPCSAAHEDSHAGTPQLSRNCSMGLHDDDITDQRHFTDHSSYLHHDRSFARLSLSGNEADGACTVSYAAPAQDPRPIPSPFASQHAQQPGSEAGQQWTPLTPQPSKALSMSRMDTLKEDKSLPFVCAC